MTFSAPCLAGVQVLTISVMITTKDRIVDLRRTCRALQQLNPPPLEVLITIDGCTADVVEAVKAELPQARVFVNPDWPRFGGFARSDDARGAR